MMRTRAYCLSGVLWLGLVQAGSAQVLPYKFVRIADTVNNPDAHIDGVNCVVLNNAGTVIIKNGQAALWRGGGGSLELVASSVGGVCRSINDVGEIAYLTTAGGTPVLVKNLGGSLVTLATATSSPFLHAPTTYLPSLTSTGSALITTEGGNAIHIVPSGLAVYDPDIHPPLFFFVSPASMNDSEQVVFTGSDSGGDAIYRNGGLVFVRDDQAVTGGTIRFSPLQRPVINNAGRIAFAGRLDPPATTGPNGVYTSTDGVNLALATSSVIDRFSLNNVGNVAYRGDVQRTQDGAISGTPGCHRSTGGSRKRQHRRHYTQRRLRLGKVAERSRPNRILGAPCRWTAGRLSCRSELAEGAHVLEQDPGMRRCQGKADTERPGPAWRTERQPRQRKSGGLGPVDRRRTRGQNDRNIQDHT